MNDMVDMSRFVEAKSDQLNADDLIGGPRTVTITRVAGNDGDQPVSIFYRGDNGKPFKPCKTIRRVLLAAWGPMAADYVGRSMTLYRDDKVTFGGLETGGIRISHMSHIDKEMTIVVMKTKGKKAGIKVLPLLVEQQADKVADGVRELLARISAGEDVTADPAAQKQRAWLAKNRPELAAEVDAALASVEGDPFGEGPATSQLGEAHAFSADDLISHIAKKVRKIDLDAFMQSHADTLNGMGEDDAQRVRDAFAARSDEIRGHS